MNQNDWTLTVGNFAVKSCPREKSKFLFTYLSLRDFKILACCVFECFRIGICNVTLYFFFLPRRYNVIFMYDTCSCIP